MMQNTERTERIYLKKFFDSIKKNPSDENIYEMLNIIYSDGFCDGHNVGLDEGIQNAGA